MTVDQLGELLYRTARTRSVRQVAEGASALPDSGTGANRAD